MSLALPGVAFSRLNVLYSPFREVTPTTRIVAEAVEEVLDASGNVRKEFLSKCGTIPCRILTLLEPADVSRLVHALFNLWVFESLERKTESNLMAEFGVIALGPRWLRSPDTPPVSS